MSSYHVNRLQLQVLPSWRSSGYVIVTYQR